MDKRLKLTVIAASAVFVIFYFLILTMFYSGENNLSPDSMDYYNIARNLESGKGFIHSIKWHYFNNDPVVHSAYAERPPLYPIVLSGVLSAGGSLKSCVYVTMLMGALATALFFLFIYFKTKELLPSILIGLLIALNPNCIRCFSYMWTESLYFLLFALTLIFLPIDLSEEKLFSNGHDKANGKFKNGFDLNMKSNLSADEIKLLLAGFFASLSYLARPTGIFVIAAIVVFFWWKRNFKEMLLFLLMPAIIIGIWFLIVWKIKGNPFYSIQKYHFVVLNIREGMAPGFTKIFHTSFPGFFYSKPVAVFQALFQSFQGYAAELFSGSYFSFTGWFLLIFPFIKMKKDGYILLIALGIINYLGHSMIWATHEGFRFMLFTFIPFLPAIVFAVFKNKLKISSGKVYRAYKTIFIGCVVILVFQYVILNINFFKTINRNNDLAEYYKDYIEYFKKNSDESDIIAGTDAFYTNYKIDRPSIILPENLTYPLLKDFIKYYNVKYFIILPENQDVFKEAVRNKLLIIPPDSPKEVFLVLKRKE